MIGRSDSNDGDISSHHGGMDTLDIWLVKLDALGNITWEKSLGGSQRELGYSVQETNDGGFIVMGETTSSDGDVSMNYGTVDWWVVKIDSNGNIQWEKNLGGSSGDGASTIRNTLDGGYIAIGNTSSNDSDVTSNPFPGFFWHIWVVKMDSLGNPQWDKVLGGSGLDQGRDIWPNPDGTYLLSAQINSSNGNGVCNHGNQDALLIKLDSSGNVIWSNCYGGSANENIKSIRPTSDNGFLIAASTSSTDGDVSSIIGQQDCWLIKVDSIGSIEWEQTYGGTNWDYISAAVQLADGSYAFAGQTNSNDVDVSGHHGAVSESDIWLVKLSSFTTGMRELNSSISGISIIPNPANISCLLNFLLKRPEHVTIEIFDIKGTKVRSLISKFYDAGAHQILWNSKNDANAEIENGIYFAKITTSSQIYSSKIILLK